MAHQIIRDARLWLAQYELHPHVNVAALAYGAEILENTVWQDSSRRRLGGLKTIALQMEGFYEAGDAAPDPAVLGNVGVVDVPVSLCPIPGAAEGSRAFAFMAALGEFQFGGQIGVNTPFSAGAEASRGPLVRGIVAHNATRTASGNGSAHQLGAIAVGKRLYAALHVLEAGGTTPSLTVKIQSDDASGFSSPTDRITFSAANAAGSQWDSVAHDEENEDDYWRVNFTISGTNPSFKFVVVMGIADDE